MIENIEISNFKSIKNLSLKCRKINLFIGKPNVGKSNILESLTLFGNINAKEVRYESARNFFYDQDIENYIQINIDDFCHIVRFDKNENYFTSHFFNSTKLPDPTKDIFLSTVKNGFASIELFNSLNNLRGANKNNLNFQNLENSPISIKEKTRLSLHKKILV